MPRSLWLTYAWVDNEDADVDFVVKKLESRGIEVRLDRIHIIAGRRLWQQIDKHLLADDLDGFAIYVTENSLRSEPCREELATALDRVLQKKGSTFPLIGIFPTAIERKLIPSAIATRLFVNLRDDDWADRIVAALSGKPAGRINDVAPYFFKEHQLDDHYVYEMRPRDGVWQPAVVIVPSDQFSSCEMPFVWAKGHPRFRPSFYLSATIPEQVLNGRSWRGHRVDQQADSTQSLYLPCREKLASIIFGDGSKGKVWVLDSPNGSSQ